MTVSIGEISSEFTVSAANRPSSGGGSADPPAEVRVEELRAINRELLIEELKRYLRLAVDR